MLQRTQDILYFNSIRPSSSNPLSYIPQRPMLDELLGDGASAIILGATVTASSPWTVVIRPRRLTPHEKAVGLAKIAMLGEVPPDECEIGFE